MPTGDFGCPRCGSLLPCTCIDPGTGRLREGRYLGVEGVEGGGPPPPRVLIAAPPRPCCFPPGSCILPTRHGGPCLETEDEVAAYQKHLRKEIRSRYRWERFFAWLFRQPKPKAPVENPLFFLAPLPEAIVRNRARRQSRSPVVLDAADE